MLIAATDTFNCIFMYIHYTNHDGFHTSTVLVHAVSIHAYTTFPMPLLHRGAQRREVPDALSMEKFFPNFPNFHRNRKWYAKMFCTKIVELVKLSISSWRGDKRYL